ncbi:hypothetical protein [Paenibacillus sonchi]|uniref:hypothetical protein n=1 Tax=Paenibacillus sonchi TaxID=373687 RepID=UPI001E47073D|nr:hypothetical protein [Paenibacillus sonchi]MCE3202484.1 hypothetical protein [Paenibacillus sonchi]
MKITEYTLVERQGVGKLFYSIQLGDNMFYKTYETDGIKVTSDLDFANRIATEQYALEVIGFLQNFFDIEGNPRPENKGKTIPPLVGLAEAAEMLGWDKRKLSTYRSRGGFPEPIQQLASGPIWTYKQIEDYRDSRD